MAQAARPHLRLQNIIHWVKSIAIERSPAGAARRPHPRSGGRPLQADQQRPLPERLPRVHLPLHAARDRPASIGWRSGVPYQDQSNIARWRGGSRRRALPRQHVVHPLRNDSAARPRPSASGDVPVAAAGTVPAAARLARASRLAMDPFTGLGEHWRSPARGSA